MINSVGPDETARNEDSLSQVQQVKTDIYKHCNIVSGTDILPREVFLPQWLIDPSTKAVNSLKGKNSLLRRESFFLLVWTAFQKGLAVQESEKYVTKNTLPPPPPPPRTTTCENVENSAKSYTILSNISLLKQRHARMRMH